MKKVLCKLVAVCVTLSMLLGIMPSVALADSQVVLDEQFATYGGGYGGNAIGLTSGISITGGWTIAHTAQSGRFGKDASDKSFNAGTASLSSANTSYFNVAGLYGVEPIPTYASGDILEFSFQVAKNDQTPFAVALKGTNYAEQNILVVDALGGVTFAGAKRGSIPGYKLGKWYDYKIVFAFGDLASGASLYIDGVPYAEDVILANALISQFTLCRMYTLNTSNGSIKAGTFLDTSVDSMTATKYTEGDYAEDANIDLYSTDESITFVTNDAGNNASIMVNDASMAVEDVVEAIGGNFSNAQLLDENFALQSGTVKAGYLKVTKADGRDSWIVVETLGGTYFEENFEGASPAMKFTMWSADRANIAETFEGGIGGKDANDKANILKSEGKKGRQESSIGWKWSQTAYKNIASDVTFEMQVYRSNANFTLANPYYHLVFEDGSDSYSQVSNSLSETGRWIKYAYHFDSKNNKLIIYKNGVKLNEINMTAFDIAYRFEVGTNFSGSEDNPLPWVAGLDNFRYSFGPYDPSADVVSLSVNEGNGVTLNGDKISVKNPMTKEAFLSALSYGDATAKIFDSEEFASTAKADVENVVEVGQWLLLYSANGEVIQYYEIEAPIGSTYSVYFEEKFEGASPAMKFTMWSADRANIAETFEGGIGGKDANDKANILKSEGKKGRQEKSIGWKWLQSEYKNIESDVTFEMQVYRSNANFALATPYYYLVYEDGSDTYTQLNGEFSDVERWVKIAYHFDSENDKVIVYRNGVKVSEKDMSAFDIAYRLEVGANYFGSEENPTPWVAGLDNFRYSFGPYDPSADVITLSANADKGIRVSADKVFIANSMAKADFLASLSFGDATAKIFDSAEFASTSKADSENIVDNGQWLLLYSANGEVIEYYEICKDDSFSAITVDENETKITASSEVALYTDTFANKSFTLFVAAYSGDKLVGIDLQTKTPVIGEVTPFSAEIIKESGMNISAVKAFMWDENLVPAGTIYSSAGK